MPGSRDSWWLSGWVYADSVTNNEWFRCWVEETNTNIWSLYMIFLIVIYTCRLIIKLVLLALFGISLNFVGFKLFVFLLQGTISAPPSRW